MTEPHPADSHDRIRVVRSRVNNLRDVTVELPKRRLTVFTGVSGSGKSSLVFGTIAAESQRLTNDTYGSFVQQFMPTVQRPDVDLLDGLTTVVAVDQERMAANVRSTVGTVTDADAMLRILFSRRSEPFVGPPGAFSFNVPSVSGVGVLTAADGTREKRSFERTGGMCPTCEGRGTATELDLTEVYDASLSLNEGAILVPGYKVGGWMVQAYADSGFLDPDKPIGQYSDQELDDFLYREPVKVRVNSINVTYEGLVPKLQGSILAKDPEGLQPHVRAFVDAAVVFTDCPDCDGTRLAEPARTAVVAGRTLPALSAMEVRDLAAWVEGLDEPSLAPVVASLRQVLGAFVAVGLGYLSLGRASGTLSGGEAQRVRTVKHLGSSLTDVTYVFDEPTAGLHSHDVARMNQLLLALRDKGNTVLVVEHKPEVVAIADHVVDLGPGAGTSGGSICFEGDVAGLMASDTLTGRHLADRGTLREEVRTPTGAIEIRGATTHNLRGVDVDLPLGVLVAVTGVSGSGKSSLVHGSLPADAEVVLVDQSPIRGNRRSSPATYTKLLDPVRKAFAKANGAKPSLFSSNSAGACAVCNGNGEIELDLGFMSTVSTTCEVCGGHGFAAAALEHTLGGRTIAEVLDMPVEEALPFFAEGEARTPAAATVLRRLRDVGLGYLRLGQPLPTLSGGERQRLRLAVEMARTGSVYVLDEPTTGLHLADVRQLLALLDQLVDGGSSVIVIEHHLAVVAHADWVVDLGPGAGSDGGTVVFEGTPAALAADASTHTGVALAAHLAA